MGWCRALVVAVLVVAAVPVSAAAATPGADEARVGDPALSVDPATVHAAMRCRGPVGGGGREPVLLVHGTSMTGDQSYGWNYLPGLAARGLRVCTVDLPSRGLGDIQSAAEFVVVAVHRLARESGRKVDVLGHSQGALEARWAVRWWPSVQAEVDDLVSLAGPNQGTTASLGGLVPAGCAACTQMAPGSAFLTALNGGDQTPGSVSFTSLYSTLTDELITPNATAARIVGASNIEVQALCAARVVTHGSIIIDAVAFAMVIDALGRAGPATPSRFDRSTCLQTTFVALPATLTLGMLLQPVIVPAARTSPMPEPALKPYARPQAGRLATVATTAAPVAATAPATTAPNAVAPAGGSAPATSSTAPTATSTTPVSAWPVQPDAPVGLSARPARATPSTDAPASGLLAGLALALVTGAAGGVIVRRRGRPAGASRGRPRTP